MAKRLNARRYARAAFEIALKNNELDRWHSDLNKVAVLGQDESVVTLLQNPRLPPDIRTRVLTEQLKGISPLVLNLVQLLLARRGLGMTGTVAEAYEELLYKHRGIERARVTTAVPLTDEEKQQVAESLGAITGKKVIVQSDVDPALVGGIVVRIGGKLLDGSTRNKLQALKRQLAVAAV